MQSQTRLSCKLACTTEGRQDSMRRPILAITILLAIATGCDQLADRPQPSARPSESHPHPIGRFEKLQNFRVDVALDTQTGQLCKTWQWESTNRKSPDPYENLPTCESLYKNFPPVEEQSIAIRTGTDNSNGKRVFSCDDGKTWNWADGSGPRTSGGGDIVRQ